MNGNSFPRLPEDPRSIKDIFNGNQFPTLPFDPYEESTGSSSSSSSSSSSGVSWDNIEEQASIDYSADLKVQDQATHVEEASIDYSADLKVQDQATHVEEASVDFSVVSLSASTESENTVSGEAVLSFEGDYGSPSSSSPSS